MSLEHKTAVVIGASGTDNFGVAIARKLAANGCTVVVSGRRIEPLRKLAGELEGVAVACDISDEAQVKALFETAHTETVMVVYNQELTDFWTLLESFWIAHNPTQGMKQGNDVGTQYRSAIFWTDDMQKMFAEKSMSLYQDNLNKAGMGKITTEIKKAREFYFAEDAHQQYLHKNPNGYCGLSGTGISF